jgi:hypothetical protein
MRFQLKAMMFANTIVPPASQVVVLNHALMQMD